MIMYVRGEAFGPRSAARASSTSASRKPEEEEARGRRSRAGPPKKINLFRRPRRRARARALSRSRPGRGAPPERNVAAGGRGRDRCTERGPVTVCRHNLGGRPPRGRSSRQSRARAPADGSAAQRSGRVSGIRPSDRRGPGPVGHRGRNVRSTGRCSYNLRITRRRADSCGLHRSTSQVIRRSGSGVCVKKNECFLHARDDRASLVPGAFATCSVGVAARGPSAWKATARGHGVGMWELALAASRPGRAAHGWRAALPGASAARSRL